MKHNIELDNPKRILVVEEPGDDGDWLFAIIDGVHGTNARVYMKFDNKRFFELDRWGKSWETNLTGQLRSPLYNQVSSSFLDAEWESKIFPQIEKIIRDYNSSPTDAE